MLPRDITNATIIGERICATVLNIISILVENPVISGLAVAPSLNVMGIHEPLTRPVNPQAIHIPNGSLIMSAIVQMMAAAKAPKASIWLGLA